MALSVATNPPLRVIAPKLLLRLLTSGWPSRNRTRSLAGSTRPTRSREAFLKERTSVPFEALRDYAQGLAAPDPDHQDAFPGVDLDGVGGGERGRQSQE